jgi:hypothetical protein
MQRSLVPFPRYLPASLVTLVPSTRLKLPVPYQLFNSITLSVKRGGTANNSEARMWRQVTCRDFPACPLTSDYEYEYDGLSEPGYID